MDNDSKQEEQVPAWQLGDEKLKGEMGILRTELTLMVRLQLATLTLLVGVGVKLAIG